MASGPKITRQTTLGEVMDRYPHIADVLEEWDVFFDPFTYIVLRSSVEEAAGYNAIQDVDGFVTALQRAAHEAPPEHWREFAEEMRQRAAKRRAAQAQAQAQPEG